jgi:ferredoxin
MSDQHAEVAADRGLCAGSGLCRVAAPEFFDVEAGLVRVLRHDVPAEAVNSVAEAVESCPMQALSLETRA